MTARSNHGMALFGDPSEHQLFLQILWRTAREFRWSCLSYCLMPNHYHLLVRHELPNLSAGMKRLGVTYARRYNDRRDRYGHVFQGRFGSRLVGNRSHLYATLRYIALNPVRAGLCTEPAAFPWSAHRALLGLDPPRLVAVRETWDLFAASQTAAIDGYRAFVGDQAADAAFAAELEEGLSASPDLTELAANADPDTVIAVGHLQLGHSFAAIGRALGRNRSSVARRFATLQAARATRGV